MEKIEKKYGGPLWGKLVLAAYLYVMITTLSILMILIFSSCKKEEFDFDRFAGNKDGADWGIPLVHGKLSVMDIINDTSNITLSHDNMISLVYSSDVATPLIADLITIPDMAFNSTYLFNMPEYVPADDSIFIPYTQLMDISPGEGAWIDSLEITSCIIDLTFTTDLDRNARIKVLIPSAINSDGQMYKMETFYWWDGNQSSPILLTIDLGGYSLGLIKSGGIPGNLEVLIDLTVFNNGNPDNSPYTLDVGQEISNVSFEKFKGYVGELVIPFASTSIPLDIFKNSLSGSIDFQNPRIKFVAKNLIGAPIQVQFANIKSYFVGQPEMNTKLVGGFENQAWLIDPAKNGKSVKSTNSSYEINKGNSNIRDLLFAMPDRLTVSAKIKTNPNGGASSNFFYNDSHASMSMEVELPLHGIADKLILRDDFRFNFDDMDKLKSAEFKVNIENSFPVNAVIQVYFADADKAIVDSLFLNQAFVEAGQTDPYTMQVVSPAQSTFTNTFDEGRLAKIKFETQHILVQVMLDTPENTVIKIFATNYLDVHIGALFTKY